MLNTANISLLTPASHVVALITPELVNPAHPEHSRIFEKAAHIQTAFSCRVTVLHVTPPTTLKSNLEESLALKVLMRRVNKHFNSDFESRTEIAEPTFRPIERILQKLSCTLVLKENPSEPGDKLDTTGISLLTSGIWPVWYINTEPDSIEAVSAKVLPAEKMHPDDRMTRDIADEFGKKFDSDVEVVAAIPDESDNSDLVITCVPTPHERSNKILNRLRNEAISMLRSSAGFDLLIHRGHADSVLVRAA